MTLFGLPQAALLTCLFFIGAVVGGFLNTCIDRIPRYDRFADQLKSLLRWPWIDPWCGCHGSSARRPRLAGWFMPGVRGVVFRHGAPARYGLVEVLNGAFFALLYWYEVPADSKATITAGPFFATMLIEAKNFSPEAAAVFVHMKYVYHLVLIESLIAATFIDFDRKIIPDATTLPAMVVGLIGAFAAGTMYLVPVWFQDTGVSFTMRNSLPDFLHPLFPATRVPAWIFASPHWHGLAVSVAGLLVGGASIWGIRLIGQWVLRQEAMGFGDVILMAVIGSFLGWQPTLVVFFIAPALALVVVMFSWIFRRQREIPYGPYLSLATIFVLFGWQTIWEKSERFFDLGPLLALFGLFAAAVLAVSLMSMQLAKRLLGFKLAESEWIEEWTSADQLKQFAGDKIDEEQHGPFRADWPGIAAGRGILFEQRWRGDGP